MMPASKHGDPQLGVDIHFCIVPPSPSPVPLPTPHMSIVFDPFDYVPYLGATVTVCGMKRATAGTNATVVHIPPGFPFAPKLPDKDDELFMGSSTVVADGDPFSFIAVPVLGCQVAGLISPPRLKKKGAKKAMLLPTTFNLAIPTSVFVGGPPTISLMGMAGKLGFAALGKFLKSKFFKRIRQKLFGHMKPGFLKCLILRAEPVNILTGEVSVEQEDFNLPGRIPIQWMRTYASGNRRQGLCGYGWESPADGRIEIDAEGVSMHYPGVGPLHFARLPIAQGEAAAELELMDGARITDHGSEYRIRTKEDRVYHFSKELTTDSSSATREIALSRISDLCGNWLDFKRRGGRLVSINESSGRRIEIVVENNLIREVALYVPEMQSRHVFIRLEHDLAGDLVAVRDPLNNPYNFSYDAHRMVRHTDRNGLSFYYEYDKPAEGEWRVMHAWGDGGLYDYRFEYFDAINERRITDSLGHVSVVKLDEDGLPISEIDPLGGMTIFEYDEVGRTTAVVDQDGHRTAYEYDERGNLLKLTRPDDKSIQTEFNTGDKAITIVDPNGAMWQQQWDVRGLLVEQTTPLGNLSRYEYDTQGQLVAFINPRNARTELAFDAVGNLASLNDALGHRTLFTYDLLGNVTGKRDPLSHNTRYVYDAKGRLIQAWLPSGATIACGYDHEDNLTRYIDENGAETRLEYFGQGEISKRIQPDGHTVQYQYDTEERLIGVTNQRGEIYQLKRDALGRIVEEVDYWGQSRHYAYDVSGYLRASADPLGRVIKYATDALGRILKKTLPDGFVEEFAYDANGNLIETKNLHVSIKREFDAEGRLVEEAQGEFTITNTYDAASNRIARETSLSNAIAYGFDTLDQVTAIRINQDAPINIGRDAVGRIAHEQLSPQLARRFSYSVDGYLTEQAVTANESPLFATRFDYDAAGNLTQRSDSRYGADVYRYDPLGRITEHLDPQSRLTRYFNDPAGDRLRTRIVESTRRQVVGADVVETEWGREGEYEAVYYRFDRAGNMVERRDGQRDLHLVWDANQRLSESHVNGTVTRYGYDPLGRRLFKETGVKRTQFYWDGDALVGETVVSLDTPTDPAPGLKGNVINLDRRREQAAAKPEKLREYVYYPQTFEPLAMIDDSEEHRCVYHYHNDPNGCPTRLTDANGAVRWGASYTAWGGIARLHVNEVENSIRLQGQYADDETGAYYNRYRYYDSSLGAYSSIDPLGLGAGDQVYWYGRNVFKWMDPLGLTCHIQGIHNDTITKGVHIDASNGVELMVRPGKDGTIVFKQVFSGEDPRAVRAAIREATEDLTNPQWLNRLKATADRATRYLADNGAPGKSAETRFLSKAIDKIL